MKIGIDISMLVYKGSGVANYTYNLVKHLLLYDKKNEYRLFYSSLRRPKNFYYLKEFKKLGGKIYDYPFPPWMLNLWWNKFNIIPVEWFIGKVDYYFSSDFLRPPLLKGTKGITTIHDLTWKIFPQFHEEEIVKGHERKLEKTIKLNDIIIVDSQNTKKDLLSHYPEILKTNKVEVIYPAIDPKFKKITDQNKIKKILEKYNVQYPEKYLLYVGAIEPRKNLNTAIKIFHKLIIENKKLTTNNQRPATDHPTTNNRQLTTNLQFLIVGHAGWKNKEIFKLIKDLKLEKRVIIVGFVEDEDLVYFYNACQVFIYLSKYEGFGLPPLEAAACGKPTLLYNNSSLKEIFTKDYPYTAKNKEIETLKLLVNKNFNLNDYACEFTWKKYCSEFLKNLEL